VGAEQQLLLLLLLLLPVGQFRAWGIEWLVDKMLRWITEKLGDQ